MRSLRVLFGLAWLAACEPPPDPADSAGAPEPQPAAPPPMLVETSNRPLGDGYAALGLSGVNKPDGMEYRLRRSVPRGTPAFVPRRMNGLELWIADPAPDGAWLAYYRGSLELRPGWANAEYRAVLFGPGGERRWELDLGRLLSHPTHLEIQDVRLHGDALYFNEACQSYSREAGGRCSYLTRVDPVRGSVVWRTRPLVSNDVFLLHDRMVVAGYGFTAEPDSLFLVEQETGRIVASHGLDSAHAYLEVVDGKLVVATRSRVYTFEIR